MTLPYREERLLRRADHALCRSDPNLASLLSVFAWLNAAEPMPVRACGAAPVRRVRELRAALTTPTVMASADERIGWRGNSRNGPFGRGF
jgi:hypothetical protein